MAKSQKWFYIKKGEKYLHDQYQKQIWVNLKEHATKFHKHCIEQKLKLFGGIKELVK